MKKYLEFRNLCNFLWLIENVSKSNYLNYQSSYNYNAYKKYSLSGIKDLSEHRTAHLFQTQNKGKIYFQNTEQSLMIEHQIITYRIREYFFQTTE